MVVPPGRPVRCSRGRSALRTTASTTSPRWGRRARAFAEAEADRAIAIGRYEAVLLGAASGPRDRRRGRLLGVARRARLDARRAIRWRPPSLARVRRRPVRGAAATPSVTVIVAAYNEETVIERRLENLLALDYPADRLEIVVTSDASTDRTDELVEAVAAREPRVRLIRCPRGGKVAAQDRAVRETDGEIVAFSDANATWAPDALAQARPLVRRPRGRLRLRPARAHRRGRLEPRGRLLALRDVAARAGVGARLGHRRQRLDLRGAPLRLRRGRPALRARPLAPVPDGAARPAGRLRPGGARVREADAGDRDRVPAQGAHVRALLADRPARPDAPPPAARVPRRDPLPPSPALRQRPAAPGRCSGRTSRSSRCAPASVYDVAARAPARVLRARGRVRRGLPRYYALVTWATVVSLWNYLRRGVPATWDAAEGTR